MNTTFNCWWQVLGESVTGASHERSGTDNQDSWWKEPPGDDDTPLVSIAVSDGHGSDYCFRSKQGAELAVKVATRVLLKSVRLRANEPEKTAGTIFQQLVAEHIVRAWKEKVANHHSENPFTIEEEELLKSKQAPGTQIDNFYLAYGATLIAAEVTEKRIFYYQLGDGEIITTSESGDQVEHPITEDSSLIANETTSLCMEGAERHFRFASQKIEENTPKLILLTTDGYPNSFATSKDFERVGLDIRQSLKKEGVKAVNTSLKKWLREASDEGSGDDCTLAIMWRREIMDENAPIMGNGVDCQLKSTDVINDGEEK